jgi:AcrR family transcriptional regulator
MVQVTHCGDNTLKINTILLTAQKRFGMFGLEKTTMSEIARDVGISKASLYYYFPDKEHLYKKVIENEQEAFFHLIDKNILETSDHPEDMIRKFMAIRLNYFRTFFNLSRLRLEDFRHMKPVIEDILTDFRKKEINSLEIILKKGVDSGLFYCEDTHESSSLFLEMVRGVRSLLFHNKDLMYVEQEDYDTLLYKMNKITNIFIKSLKFRA